MNARLSYFPSNYFILDGAVTLPQVFEFSPNIQGFFAHLTRTGML